MAALKTNVGTRQVMVYLSAWTGLWHWLVSTDQRVLRTGTTHDLDTSLVEALSWAGVES